MPWVVRVLLVVTFTGLLAGCASARRPGAASRFKILQINDVYKIEGLEGGTSGGLARVRSLRLQLESDGTPVLVLHAGDALYPSVMSKYLEARPMVEVLNLLDGSAEAHDPRMVVTLGNHELDQDSADVLLARLADSDFLWVTANTRWCNPTCDQWFPGTSDVVLLDAGDTRVGIFGVLFPISKRWARSTDPIGAARDAVAVLRGEGAEVVVALTHQSMEQDVELVRAVPGIDLVIGGHEHVFMQRRVEGTWITKADADAKSAVVYDVTVPAAGPLQTAPLRVVLDETMPKDPTVDAAVGRWLTALGERLGGNETIGTTLHLLEGVEPAVRGRETALGNLLTDAAREQMGTQVAIVNAGAIRINDNIPPGPITRYDMEGVFYYTDRLVAFTATGSELLGLLRNAVSRADSGDGRFLQVSGLAFRYRATEDGFTVDPGEVTVGGAPLDLDARYTVATIGYVYRSGEEDGYTLFSEANRPPQVHRDREADFRATVEAYIRARGQVTTNVEGRIVRQ